MAAEPAAPRGARVTEYERSEMWTVEERIERPVAEVAELLHISEGALYAAMRLGDLKSVKRGERGGRAVTTLA